MQAEAKTEQLVGNGGGRNNGCGKEDGGARVEDGRGKNYDEKER